MIKLTNSPVLYHADGTFEITSEDQKPHYYNKTLAYGILKAHNTHNNMSQLKIRFDALASHDITYVGIIQTAKASGMTRFPLPYILTNCHNSLCAVGGTINEDDHIFGRSAAEKYGGVYVPAHQAVIHQFMRETMASSGGMILGSDSHTRYGALGTMAIGEGGPELAKQLLNHTYDIDYPDIVGIHIKGSPRRGIGPQDVALSLIKAVFDNGFVKNAVVEFVGDGIESLSVDYRNGIDVMTTETTCLSSIWETDKAVATYLEKHERPNDYKPLKIKDTAYYDRFIEIDLSGIENMIALPFHPSHVYTIKSLNENPYGILAQVENDIKAQLDNPFIHFSLVDKIKDGAIYADQGIIAGCSGGTYENIALAAEIVKQKPMDAFFNMSIYPSSQPVNYSLLANGYLNTLMVNGIALKTAFCGPCFGAGDVPQNNGFSIRHTTRNFPSREGSKPSGNQIASVALMDAMSIMATAVNGGRLTPATELFEQLNDIEVIPFAYEGAIYDRVVYNGIDKAQADTDLIYGPNIADWPAIPALGEHLILKNASIILDPVTTTDELIPSGETSSYRSNPLKLAEFTLSRKDPHYVEKAKAIHKAFTEEGLIENIYNLLKENSLIEEDFASFQNRSGFGSNIFAKKPGDGSAREQAASCQRVLGGAANIALEYATKRYQSNLINWGMIPFTIDPSYLEHMQQDDIIFIPNLKSKLNADHTQFEAVILRGKTLLPITLKTRAFTPDEKAIITQGCLINFYNQA